MKTHQLAYLSYSIIIKLEALQNPSCDFFTDTYMSPEMCDPFLIDRFRHRFSHVMKKHGKPQYLLRRNVHHRMDRMLADMIAVMKILLLCYHHNVEFRENHGCDTKFICQPDALRVRRYQQFDEFHLYALGTDIS